MLIRSRFLCFFFVAFSALNASGIRVSFGKHAKFEAEIAQTSSELERGLMQRKSLAPGKGMLFVFPDSQNRAFWMKNTLIALDMIFLDDQKRVVGIIENAVPWSLERRQIEAPSRFVLEINAGQVKKSGIRIGSIARWKLP